MLPALVLAIGFALPWSGRAAELQDREPGRYQRTIRALHGAPPEVASTFAESALTELIAIYLAEADLARREAGASDEPGKLLGWARAVEQYTGDMLILLEDVQQGFPVSLTTSPPEASRLAVAGRSIILSHPRATQQSEFERRVLADFCSRLDCAPLTARGLEQQPIPVSVSMVTPSWSFAPGSALCAYRGLSVRFGSEGDLARKRGLCNQLFQELAVLVNELAWQRRHGVAVQWEALSIHPVPRQPEHVVILNSEGDSILASVPLVYSTPGLLQDIRPWLQAVHENRRPASLQLESGRYGWEAGAP